MARARLYKDVIRDQNFQGETCHQGWGSTRGRTPKIHPHLFEEGPGVMVFTLRSGLGVYHPRTDTWQMHSALDWPFNEKMPTGLPANCVITLPGLTMGSGGTLQMLRYPVTEAMAEQAVRQPYRESFKQLIGHEELAII